ncbi:vWA domain-containing protein [Granulicella aggregans]|uniref:hypothetical protein n=1 Tax=Granulicella aggregans TaxID=474949 RepID=UPI0021DFC5E3|nr:hypothetical protein [Granulicella aggregans]
MGHSRSLTSARSMLSLTVVLLLPGSCAILESQTADPAAAAPAAVVAPAAPSAAATSVPTLEMALLITDHIHRPVDDVPVEKLRLKTANGTQITPLSMRREGEDPLSLVILIDASRDSFHDLSKLGDEFAGLVGSQLLPTDRITMYAADCTMTRSMNNAVPDAAALRKGVSDAMSFPTLHGGKEHSACGKTFPLWDDVAVAVAGLSHAPGRRVILLISSGENGGGKYDWLTVEQYAFDQGVAIFGLRDKRQSDADDFSRNALTTTHGTPGSSVSLAPPAALRSANNLELLCANDGGLTLTSAPEFRRDGIAGILFLIRNRFILTIPKDAYPLGTTHGVKVTQTGISPYFMTATGALEPMVK